MSNMVIQTNTMALNSHRNLKTVGGKQATASARLSSGYRVNTAADDAAGLAISEKMRAQIRGLDMASKNAQDGISLVQTAEGGMQEIDNMLQRVRELVVQVSNDTNEHNDLGTGDRQKMQDEVNALVSEIDSMSERVEFNKKKLINGDALGATAENEKINAVNQKLVNLTGGVTNVASAAAATGTAGGIIGKAFASAATLSSQAKAVVASDAGGSAIASLADLAAASIGNRADVDAKIAEIDKYISDVDSRATTKLTDANRTALYEKQQALMKAHKATATVDALRTSKAAITKLDGKDLYLQVGANSFQGFDVSISSIKSDVLGIGDGMGHTSINLLKATGKDTTAILETLDVALSYVTTERSKLGAVQNRLEYTIKSLDTSSENLSAAESRIRDTDMAKEMMKFTQSNVLQQAATSMLAQANQSPQNVLKLLQ